MKLSVLPNQFHGGEVHSIDLNCTNTLVATCGSDLAINVWTLGQLTEYAATSAANTNSPLVPDTSIPLAAGTLKLLRWSPVNDSLLVCAGENGHVWLVDVILKAPQPLFPFGTAADSAADSAAVVDGGWSPDGRLFAWSSADSKVHLVDIANRTHQLVIDESSEASGDRKTTIQRSVAFDPSRRYFICMGDDSFVTVFKYRYDSHDKYVFEVACKISKLMSNSVSVSAGINYRRISWSCDGEFVAVPNASKQLSSVVSLISVSEGWENNVVLVGHDLECDVVRFAPHLFEYPPEEPGLPPSLYHIIATTGSDSTLVLWNTSRESPILVIRDFTTKPIVDLVWQQSGDRLFMVSLDGRLAIAEFFDNELGSPALEEITKLLLDSQVHKTDKLPTATNGDAKKTKNAAEIINQKAASKMDEEKPEKNRVQLSAEASTPALEESEPEPALVGEITPKIVSADLSDPDGTNVLEAAMTDRTKTEKPKTKVVKIAKVAKPTTIQSQKTTTKDGKKRIQPTLLLNGSGTQPQDRDIPSLVPRDTSAKSQIELEKPSYSIPEKMFKDNKRAKLDENGAAKKIKRELEPVKYIGSVVVNHNTTFSKIRLSVPKIRNAFRLAEDEYILDVKNGQGNEGQPSRVTYFKNETQLWCDFIPRFIHLATKGANFWALCTSDGQIYTYTKLCGSRLLPPIMTGSPLSFLESKGKFLMAVTSVAELYVWNLELKKIHIKSPLSLGALLDLHNKFQDDLLSKSDNVTMCSITSSGVPLVTLSNGAGYMYNLDMEVWQTVTEAWWAFGSHYWNSLADDKVSSESRHAQLLGETTASSIVGLLEHKTNEELFRRSRTGRGKFFNKILKNMVMKEGFENLENTISLAHLENRILCCGILGENDDYRNLTLTYTKRLSELGLRAKLFEVCERILGADDSQPICGHPRRQLLKDVIVLCVEHRDVQRVLLHFGNLIGIVESEYS